MYKILLLSVVVFMLMIPVIMSHDQQPRRGLRRTLILVAVFNTFYVFFFLVVWPWMH